jgi:hypothetical protein
MTTAPEFQAGERRAARLAVWTVAVLGGWVILELAAIGAALWRLGPPRGLSAPGRTAVAEAAASDGLLLRISWGQLAVALLAAILWLAWLYGAYANLRALGCGKTRQTPGRAIGFWFMPVIDVIWPYQMVKELWLRSATANAEEELAPARSPALVGAWWMAFLAGGALGLQSMQPVGVSQSLLAPTWISLASDALLLVAALLAIAIVRRISRLQRAAAGGGGSLPAMAMARA